jgi:hypothetical protein
LGETFCHTFTSGTHNGVCVLEPHPLRSRKT